MSATVIGTLFMLCAVASDILANVFIKKSLGFRRKKHAAAAIVLVGLAFIFLALSIHYIELSVAYAMFGAVGILCTTAIDKAWFGLQIRPIGILGITMMIIGIVLLQTA